MLINADLHIHGCFSMATSKDMLIKNIAYKGKLKGLNLIGTGDVFHPKWQEIIKDFTVYDGDGIYTCNGVDFLLTVEVEAKHRIHHLMFLPDMDVAVELSKILSSKNKTSDGRPKTNISAPDLHDLAHDHDCLIGPAHAFTPWTGMYKTYDSIYDCYEATPDFVELGLSADTDMADRISELKDFVFLTNSDAHSPWPHRLGREFNQIKLDDISYTSLKKALKHKNITANYGMVPDLGKYHRTACTRCFKLIEPEVAAQNNMRCECGGIIKKGVDFRISEIADFKNPIHPDFRPRYIHLMPLAEIIATVKDKGVTTKTVQNIWNNLIDRFGTEIDVLINADLNEIRAFDVDIYTAIKAFRDNTINIHPGGGGKYGEINFKKKPVLTLDNF